MIPLHVQTAEVLGWTDIKDEGGGVWTGLYPPVVKRLNVTRYDTSWCSTGPLIQRYGIGVECLSHGWIAIKDIVAHGGTPLEAACRLIVALKKEGKLNE